MRWFCSIFARCVRSLSLSVFHCKISILCVLQATLEYLQVFMGHALLARSNSKTLRMRS